LIGINTGAQAETHLEVLNTTYIHYNHRINNNVVMYTEREDNQYNVKQVSFSLWFGSSRLDYRTGSLGINIKSSHPDPGILQTRDKQVVVSCEAKCSEASYIYQQEKYTFSSPVLLLISFPTDLLFR
jgi:hypothetical protein